MVIGAVKSNQSNSNAADGLEPTLTVEVKKPAVALLGFRRNLSVLAGTGVDKIGSTAVKAPPASQLKADSQPSFQPQIQTDAHIDGLKLCRRHLAITPANPLFVN